MADYINPEQPGYNPNIGNATIINSGIDTGRTLCIDGKCTNGSPVFINNQCVCVDLGQPKKTVNENLVTTPSEKPCLPPPQGGGDCHTPDGQVCPCRSSVTNSNTGATVLLVVGILIGTGILVWLIRKLRK